MNQRWTQRALDLMVAVPLGLISLPVQAAVAVAVARRLGRPVLFHQVRPGLDGTLFTLHKFRTMLPIDPDRGHTDDASRVTNLGRLLRATSLDELPTLWNVIRGDMSLVGPRPLLVEYLDRYTPEQARRHQVRPGITGLAQISGRNAMTWEHKLALDARYVDTRSLRLDLRILARTIRSVLARDGITAHGEATTTVFQGNLQEDAA